MANEVAECWFFGVWSHRHKGHYLYNEEGHIFRKLPEGFPCTASPDGTFLRQPVSLYVPQVWRTEGWTVYALWDRAGDSRPGSSSTFIIRGEHSDKAAWEVIRHRFPLQAGRIEEAWRKTTGQ